jgi:hypothetical protein
VARLGALIGVSNEGFAWFFGSHRFHAGSDRAGRRCSRLYSVEKSLINT